jgi:hypothetical protein
MPATEKATVANNIFEEYVNTKLANSCNDIRSPTRCAWSWLITLRFKQNRRIVKH